MDKPDDRILERLRWRSRRGLLELDLILTRFLETKLAALSQQEVRMFDEVLRLQDNDFLDLLMGRVQCCDHHIKPMLNMIASCRLG